MDFILVFSNYDAHVGKTILIDCNEEGVTINFNEDGTKVLEICDLQYANELSFIPIYLIDSFTLSSINKIVGNLKPSAVVSTLKTTLIDKSTQYLLLKVYPTTITINDVNRVEVIGTTFLNSGQMSAPATISANLDCTGNIDLNDLIAVNSHVMPANFPKLVMLKFIRAFNLHINNNVGILNLNYQFIQTIP